MIVVERAILNIGMRLKGLRAQLFKEHEDIRFSIEQDLFFPHSFLVHFYTQAGS